jgi:valyl-tRNA synthetase
MPSSMTVVTLRVVLGRLLQLLHPFAPFVTEQLWQNLGFRDSVMISPWPEQIALPEKNYKINLLMDIITTFRQLRTKATDKSHEKVDIFLQAGSDMIAYVEQNAALVTKLVHVDTITYFRDGQELPTDYITDVVLNLTLGVKAIHTMSKADHVAAIEKDLASEQQFLQTLRKTLSNKSFVESAPEDVIEAKKQKMEEVKSRIETMEMELRRLKM